MFNQNDEEKKLDWMYKGPNSTVSREEYLLGRPVDKTLEQLNEEDKQKHQGLINIPKNRVEHECIPPSIRDFNKLVQTEQVDLSTKLQEDPLVAIKKREEESRRQFLQNPVQLKKLQKALKAQQAKKKKKKRKKKLEQSSDSESELDVKLTERLLGQKDKKISKEERHLETILIHKYEALKDKLSESDLQDILNGKTDSDESEDGKQKKSRNKRYESSDDSEDERTSKYRNKESSKMLYKEKEKSSSEFRYNDSHRDKWRKNKKRRSRSPKYKNRSRSSSPKYKSSSDSEPTSRHHSKKFDSDESDSSRNKKLTYGLVSSDGKKIPLLKKSNKEDFNPKTSKLPEPVAVIQKRRAHKLTEAEKEKLREEMMQNAVLRDKERAHNVKKYREKEEKERKEQNFDPEFIHKQLMKSADSSSVESRIKANLNNIQRSSRDMDKHFSKR